MKFLTRASSWVTRHEQPLRRALARSNGPGDRPVYIGIRATPNAPARVASESQN